jgi:hypothetical protein
MMLLATYMKKNGWEFEKATNGLIAMQAFRNNPQGFDVIFMGKILYFRQYSRTKWHRRLDADNDRL